MFDEFWFCKILNILSRTPHLWSSQHHSYGQNSRGMSWMIAFTLIFSVSWAGMPAEFHAFWKSPCWYQGQIARIGTGAFRCRLVFERSTSKAFRSCQLHEIDQSLYCTWLILYNLLDKGSSIKLIKGVDQCKQPFKRSTIRSTARDGKKLPTFANTILRKKSNSNTYGPTLCYVVRILGCLTLECSTNCHRLASCKPKIFPRWGQWTFGFGEQLELGPSLLGAQQFSLHKSSVFLVKWSRAIGCRVGHWEIQLSENPSGTSMISIP